MLAWIRSISLIQTAKSNSDGRNRNLDRLASLILCQIPKEKEGIKDRKAIRTHNESASL